ncbi:hypothetical protein D9M73_270350 [compost metagenome]
MSSRACSNCVSTCRELARKISPASVSAMRRVERSNRRVPNSSSRWVMARVRAEVVLPNCEAARVKLPWSAVSTNIAMALSWSMQCFLFGKYVLRGPSILYCRPVR